MKEVQMLQVQAYDYLIEIIKKGELEAGQIYSLNQMAKHIGISKTPLRDAVMRLEQERYLDMIPSKGFMLHTMTEDDILETYQIRSALEIYCFKQFSLGINTDRGKRFYSKLMSKIDSQQKIIQTTQDPEEFGRKDYEFHRSVVQYVGNQSMLDIYRQFMYRIFWLNVTSFSKPGRMADTLSEHQKLMEQMTAGTLSSLDQLLDHHLTIAQHINLEVLDCSD